ncbi:MAG: DNA polymerase III subunit gamma/tau [Oscillospiraceae bacterium]|nr:DNA polymerase III subunit gamma/tau [Oscillospiraceae bacterium]
MHKALYRKWRPMIFDDVIGQDYIVTVLKNQIASGKIGHAYLFTGSRGTGKTTCAKIFSKAVNCLNHVSGDPCLECDNCKSIQNGSAIDVVEIDAASHTGVDNIREIMEESVYLPAVCKYRVYSIDEVHMLSTSAFNALLKIMEEPPAHIIFILATTEVHQVPVTIISRCQRFDFSRIEDSLIIEQLLKVSAGEGINLENDAAAVIARLADGGMRDALSLLDQCASFDNNVTREVVSSVSGQADRSFILKVADAVINENAAEAVSLAAKAHSGSLSFSFIVSELTALYRDIMIAKSVGTKKAELFPIGSDLQLIAAYAEKMSLSQIMFCIDTLSEALNTIGKSSYPNILFEQCLIRLCSPFLSADNDALLRRIEKLEQRLLSVPTDFSPFSASQTAKPAAEVKREASKPADEPKKEAPAPAPAPQPAFSASAEGKQPFTIWDKVLELLSKTNPPLVAALKMSTAYIEGDIVYIDTTDFSFALLKGSENNRNTLKAAVAAVSGRPLKIAQYKEKRPATTQSSAMDEILKRARRNGVDVSGD